MFVRAVITQFLRRSVSVRTMAVGPRKFGCDPLLMKEKLVNRSLMHAANNPSSNDRHYHWAGNL
ncbi:MAG: hypothetical protein ACI9RO_000705 [Alteromonas macleodii]|jgi:hypothetical protein